jgi:hypothetical protein
MLSKAQKLASASIGAPLLGNVEGCFFLGAFLSRGIFMRFSRKRQMPCKQVSLSIGALMGNMEGGSFAWIFERKKKYIWVPFLDPEDTKILHKSGGHLELQQGTGLS